ncbi:arylesterase [Aliikangiella coralliicola]|uniref:Arylesterase n=1 Tax=Aliikangiella coralliicola TaxID=2592383 RepID=A0A545TWH2_9GAMM|nr:arylesterase [Aliikangiella coralliicola]TQV81568.1 arylesterase [Aliikangiella coralliicola]
MKLNFSIKNTIYGLLLIFSSQLAILSKPANANQPESHVKSILVFGDSLSAAYNIKTEQGWVSLLQDFLDQQGHNIKVINASISGETTSGGLERFAAQISRSKPDIVILELGGNDGLRGFDLTTTRENLSKMIETSINHSSQVLLAGIKIPPNYGRTYTRRFEQIYTDLAKHEKVELIPFILEKVATKSELMQADGIHPNAKGQPLILSTVWQHLKPMLTE